MKKYFVVFMILALMVSVVGCGSDNDNGNDQPQPATQGGSSTDNDDEIEIRFSWWGGDGRHEATLEVIRLFEEANPNVNVIPEYTAWSGHFERVATQLTANDEADLMQINFNWFYNFSPDGERFVDLNTLEGHIDLSNWPDEIFDAVTINGKIQGVPTSVGSRVYYMNTTIYDDLGIDIPETWDDLMAAGNQIRDELGGDYYALGNIEYDASLSLMMFGYLAQMTGKDIFDENDEISYTVEELTEGFNFVQDLVDNHVIPGFHDDSSEKNHENPNWIQGRYPATYNWPSSFSRYYDNLEPEFQENVVAVPYFKLNDNQLHSGTFNKVLMAFSVSPNSDHPEIAAQLIDFMYTNEEAVVAHGLERDVPANTVAQDILAANDLLKGVEFEGQQLIEQYDDMFTFHPFYEDSVVRSTYEDLLDEFVMAEGGMSAEEAAQRLLQETNAAMAEAIADAQDFQ
ncbi:oligogalacturonide transport system substrate-binding protein [Natranaerovirga hydrolytica]|uniref:Oligogalacturonide transport system substrate-binding protein n=1 Tax=Natranaerovirga hydrolytica TaxID=680378 RepID=A0A4R1MQB7_9FIRM|nr:ABC transporter substrate-binding protein [Natranaerovirga hydrolytica]TCK92719.1 oligogalacturonide transport system substrate-binding protein [Natranaerovirga hydrolytica]